MREWLDLLFWRTWWNYQRDAGLAYSPAYHWFNLAEGAAWLTFAALVLIRRARRQKSTIEIGYAVAFFTFGLSDFCEAWIQASWLIWLKLLNLLLLWRLRHIVIQRYYPASKLF